ncbi:hypothetical protein FQR65_LT19716 [Abscondita terminalis]|nr:hypothetical protein FQR65_LT19716 [Abscondita terminalis]
MCMARGFKISQLRRGCRSQDTTPRARARARSLAQRLTCHRWRTAECHSASLGRAESRSTPTTCRERPTLGMLQTAQAVAVAASLCSSAWAEGDRMRHALAHAPPQNHGMCLPTGITLTDPDRRGGALRFGGTWPLSPARDVVVPQHENRLLTVATATVLSSPDDTTRPHDYRELASAGSHCAAPGLAVTPTVHRRDPQVPYRSSIRSTASSGKPHGHDSEVAGATIIETDFPLIDHSSLHTVSEVTNNSQDPRGLGSRHEFNDALPPRLG